MEIIILIISIIVLAETSYLAFNARQPMRRKKEILLDTSALIDGRIVSVARSGLLTATLIVPSSVLRELQYMADKADTEKRARARFGLDVVSTLKSMDIVNLEILDDGLPEEGGVDERLLQLAKQRGARLCTTDYNLNKVARAESIYVINVNELAHALRVTYLPGEKTQIHLQQKGQNADQAVGYLDDGTMVVVEHALRMINETVEVEIIRSLQTEAGKMVFAKIVGNTSTSPQQKPIHKNPRQPKKYPTKRRQSPEDSLVELANKGPQ